MPDVDVSLATTSAAARSPERTAPSMKPYMIAEDSVPAQPDPRAATVDPRSVLAGLGERPPAHSISRLEQRHRVTGLFESKCRRQPREARPHHAVFDIHDCPRPSVQAYSR
ncbi:hypothetical protein AWB99_20905 [Mycolicibacterium confluentis]|uniref:Uncharacterized protein n=1 Tax=Mycolicibacterium confluentis TaxID=28047 RepID=A0A7I7XVS7_9MYCO|nr:hypothetical protein AWB99_20905 [Mycolicibacterium confluentis]BBZ33410.1 hypothetical protein MCNF_20150 [Mycolicibacterium confluentis]